MLQYIGVLQYKVVYLHQEKNKKMRNRIIDKGNFYLKTTANWSSIQIQYIGRPADFVSASGSQYWFLPNGVFRLSDHWGGDIASCSWYLDGKHSDQLALAHCKWEDFYSFPIRSYNFDKLECEDTKIYLAAKNEAKNHLGARHIKHFGEIYTNKKHTRSFYAWELQSGWKKPTKKYTRIN